MNNPGKLLSNKALPGFFLFFIFFFVLSGSLYAKSVIMVSRLDFVPAMLEMVKLNLEHSLKTPISLTFQPVLNTNPIQLRRKPDLLLVENGFPIQSLPDDYQQIPNAEMSLVWVLGLNSKAAEFLGNKKIKNLKEFAQLLMKVKLAKPAMFPWFEAIFSKNTFFNLNSVLGEDMNTFSNSSEQRHFWNCKGTVQILHQAMAEELLNPLSLEADELLAFDVFRSGDCIATSFWVPIDYIINPKIAMAYLGNVSLIPFPTMDGKGIMPKVTLNIWQKKSDKSKLLLANSCLIKSDEYNLMECNFQDSLNWIKDKHIERYDRLVVGDFD